MTPTPNPEPPIPPADSLQLSITDKIVLRAEGKFAILIAAATVIGVAGLWATDLKPMAKDQPSIAQD